jgi:hypothetical protein
MDVPVRASSGASGGDFIRSWLRCRHDEQVGEMSRHADLANVARLFRSCIPRTSLSNAVVPEVKDE